jgi:hypothetical protein
MRGPSGAFRCGGQIPADHSTLPSATVNPTAEDGERMRGSTSHHAHNVLLASWRKEVRMIGLKCRTWNRSSAALHPVLPSVARSLGAVRFSAQDQMKNGTKAERPLMAAPITTCSLEL